ncbi:MAG: hypothetical protein AVDCRST_MAG49-4019 [uncultured Thermomicrobiales bacterium]|uniref:Uncharacterized protein n=1 Tax=uncultured Thermomicrobiales bacterium TaxID=1645740 RepID=A0A6J4VBW1_9BACT|nr:MAG: hypothetical protein AVDCRST_MAG49-4019 [uncultured Thermomicrobiales bacterium]
MGASSFPDPTETRNLPKGRELVGSWDGRRAPARTLGKAPGALVLRATPIVDRCRRRVRRWD